jgi:hypothetical protein
MDGNDKLSGGAGDDNSLKGDDRLDGGHGTNLECLGAEAVDDAPADQDTVTNCE